MVITFNMSDDNDHAERNNNEKQFNAYINRHNILYIDEAYYLAIHELHQPIPQNTYPTCLTYVDIDALI